jgi:hypothetical protein
MCWEERGHFLPPKEFYCYEHGSWTARVGGGERLKGSGQGRVGDVEGEREWCTCRKRCVCVCV